MTITTTKPADFNSSTTTNTASSPVSPRPARRMWIAVAGAAVVLALTAAGIGYAVSQNSQEAFVPFETTNAAVADDATASIHGSGANLRTGTGGFLTNPAGTDATPSSDDSTAVAHGSGQNIVTGNAQPVH